jgi:hypothetical protein
MSTSIAWLLIKRHSFWTDSPREIVERIAKNLHRECSLDAWVAVPADTAGKTTPKFIYHVHHIKVASRKEVKV